MVMRSFNLGTLEAEAGLSPVRDQPGLHSSVPGQPELQSKALFFVRLKKYENQTPCHAQRKQTLWQYSQCPGYEEFMVDQRRVCSCYLCWKLGSPRVITPTLERRIAISAYELGLHRVVFIESHFREF